MEVSAKDKQLNETLRRKRRRNSSASKGPVNKQIVLDSNKKILQSLADKKEQDNIEFCDRILKAHQDFKLVPFQLVITKAIGLRFSYFCSS